MGIMQIHISVHSFNNFVIILVTSDILVQAKLKLGAKILAPFYILYKHLVYSQIRFGTSGSFSLFINMSSLTYSAIINDMI